MVASIAGLPQLPEALRRDIVDWMSEAKPHLVAMITGPLRDKRAIVIIEERQGEPGFAVMAALFERTELAGAKRALAEVFGATEGEPVGFVRSQLEILEQEDHSGMLPVLLLSRTARGVSVVRLKMGIGEGFSA